MAGCGGLHCPGCSEGGSVAVLGLGVVGMIVADRVSVYVADRIWWISGTAALAFALAVAAAFWIERWTKRRDEARAAAGPLMVYRATAVPIPARVHATAMPARATQQEIAPTYTFNFYGADSDTAARVFQAIPGQPGDATITERELTHGTAPHPHPRTA